MFVSVCVMSGDFGSGWPVVRKRMLRDFILNGSREKLREYGSIHNHLSYEGILASRGEFEMQA